MLNRLNGALLPDRPRLSPAPSPSRVFKGVPLSSYSVTKVSLRPPLGRCQAATQVRRWSSRGLIKPCTFAAPAHACSVALAHVFLCYATLLLPECAGSAGFAQAAITWPSTAIRPWSKKHIPCGELRRSLALGVAKPDDALNLPTCSATRFSTPSSVRLYAGLGSSSGWLAYCHPHCLRHHSFSCPSSALACLAHCRWDSQAEQKP